MALPQSGEPVDIAAYGRVVTWSGPTVKYTGGEIQKPKDLRRERGSWVVNAERGEKSVNVGIIWTAPRAVRTVVVTYADQASRPNAESQDLQAWLHPERPLEGGETAWQGCWRSLAGVSGFSAESRGLVWTYHLPPIDAGLYQFRIVLHDRATARIRSITVESGAKWRESDFEVRFDDAAPRAAFEGFNARIVSVTAADDRRYAVRALVSDAPSSSTDRAIVTVRAGSKSFSFLDNDLQSDGAIYVKPFGAVVTKPGATFVKGTGQTVTERVLRMPEQTYDGALKGIPAKNRTKWLSLSPPLNHHKWAVWPNGDCMYLDDWADFFQTSTGDVADYNRVEPQRVESGCYPVVYANWEDGGLKWEQGYAAVAANGRFEDPTAPTALVTRVSATNNGSTRTTARLWMRIRGGLGRPRRIWIVDDVLHQKEDDEKEEIVRGRLSYDGWSVRNSDGELCFTVEVPPGQTRSVELEAYSEKATTAPDKIGFAAARQETVGYWRSKLAQGANFSVPDERINSIWKSLLIHQYCWGHYDAASGTALPWVAAWQYGPVGSESSQMAKALDFYGHSKMAEDYFVGMWKIQGADGLPALCTNARGCLPGWWGGYVFNTGYQLWNLCNHYRLTGDRQWLEKVLPHLILACDWIDEQRRTTPTRDASGRRALECGFFPPCGLEDEGGWNYWVMTNAYFYLGMSTLAKVLAEIGHPDADRVAREAREYLADIRKGIGESTVLAPVVKLDDGTYVPYIPQHLYSRARRIGEFETELGGPQLMICNVYAPNSPQMDWTLNFDEDEVFMKEALDRHSIISLKDVETNWFSLGGFAKRQPFLIHMPLAYLRRDQPELAIRAFWNALVAMNYPDINAFPEGINDYGAADCKTHEEAMWLQQFRWMLVFDDDTGLRLCSMAPREWFEDGKTISVANAPTFFGQVSYRIESHVARQRISAHIELSARKTPIEYQSVV